MKRTVLHLVILALLLTMGAAHSYAQGAAAAPAATAAPAPASSARDEAWRLLEDATTKLVRLAERTDLHARLVHGSDFPLPPASTLFFGRVPLGRWWNSWKRENIFRRDFEIKQALGLPPEIYTRGYEVLAPRLAMLS